ncbi:MAG: carbohydrate transporter permease [Glaciihabitans sp.]|jgi:raffinose/stachyose/melibiose transport system permease protein|nr:carbohydrate transporter permease [Glaciihabitans sp.]MDQ1571820.1 raffinose/stachyose/melibiose transport system permease protein [Actinomycetota bacterium]
MATPDLTIAGSSTTTARVKHPRSRRRRPRSVSDWIILVIAFLVAIVVVAPFILVLLNSFKSPSDYATGGPLAWPAHLYLKGIEAFWNNVNFPLKLWNSVFISALVAVFGVAVSVLNAYALGVGRIKGRIWIVVLFLLANMLPQEAMIYPLYYMFKQVGLYDNVWAVIIILTVLESAFGTYLLSSVFSTFPTAVLEAAALDGASRWQILTRIIVPISRPTLSVLLVFFFIWSWNEFLIPLVFLVSNDNQTVPLAVATLTGQRTMDITTTSASALLGLLPTLIFFLIFQRTLTKGITAGAVK